MKAEFGKTPTPKQKTYRVAAEGGIFKNGKLFKKGETVPVDQKDEEGNLVGLSSSSLGPAIEVGDIEEVKEDA